MYSFKKSLIAFAGLLALVAASMPLIGRGQGQAGDKNPLQRDPRRSYYLTQTTHNGAQAPSACAAGYHMASLWEIFDTSNLRYETELGLTQADSGFGPPTSSQDASGWIRTGRLAGTGTIPGAANCIAYTRDDDGLRGTVAHLPDNWDSTSVTKIDPWEASTRPCNLTARVWCVQD